jgi:hypothetical protein
MSANEFALTPVKNSVRKEVLLLSSSNREAQVELKELVDEQRITSIMAPSVFFTAVSSKIAFDALGFSVNFVMDIVTTEDEVLSSTQPRKLSYYTDSDLRDVCQERHNQLVRQIDALLNHDLDAQKTAAVIGLNKAKKAFARIVKKMEQ